MVKVEDLSLEDISKRHRESHLEEIAKKTVGRFKVSRCLTIHVCSSPIYPFGSLPIHVFSDDNSIQVSNSKYFEMAIKLAVAYEKAGEGEFTVKKKYND